MYGSQWGSLAAARSLSYFYYKLHENPRIRISTASHVRICIRYYKSHALHLNIQKIEGSYDKIIITIVPSYTGNKYHKFVIVSIVTHTAHP